jgi:hypothetical protein
VTDDRLEPDSVPPPAEAKTDPAPAPTATDMTELRELLLAVNERLDKISDDAREVAEATFTRIGELDDRISVLDEGQAKIVQRLDDAIEVGGGLAIRAEQIEKTLETLTNEYLVLDHRTSDRAGATAEAISRLKPIHGEQDEEETKVAGGSGGE